MLGHLRLKRRHRLLIHAAETAFDLGAARKRRDTRAMDIDIPLDGDGTGEYEPLRQLHDTFSADNIPTEMTNHVYYFL